MGWFIILMILFGLLFSGLIPVESAANPINQSTAQQAQPVGPTATVSPTASSAVNSFNFNQ